MAEENEIKAIEDSEKAEEMVKEETKTEEKTPKKRKKREIPVYFWILIIILAVVVTLAASIYIIPLINQPQNGADINGSNPVYLSKVNVKLLYSSDCNFCEQTNSIITVFDIRGVSYELEKIDVSLQENQHYLDDFEPDSVPTALIDSIGIEKYPQIAAIFKADTSHFKLKKGFYVVPEYYLDKVPHNWEFLKTIDENCSIQNGTVKLEMFCDLMDEHCAAALKETDKLKTDFNAAIDFSFRHFVFNGEDAERIAIAAECAKREGKFDEFIQLVFKYEFPESDENKVDVSNPSYLLGIGMEAGLDKNAMDRFVPCLAREETKNIVGIGSAYDQNEIVGSDNILALKYRLGWVPGFILDCKYVFYGYDDLKAKICSMHPEIAECKQNA